MKRFYFCSTTRRDVPDLFFADISERLTVVQTDSLDEIRYIVQTRDDQIVALWNEDPRRSLTFPSTLICSNGSIVDWTAWLTTYLAKIRPISAFSRLVEQNEFESLLRRSRDPYLNSALWPFVGLIIGEVLASAAISDRQLEQLSLSAYESTLSFALFRSFAVSGDTRDFSAVRASWEAVRHLTKQHVRAVDASSTARICELAVRAGNWIGPTGAAEDMDFDLLSLSASMLEEQGEELIERRLSRALGIQINVSGTREERVSSFGSFIDRVSMSSEYHHREMLSLVLGYMASRIAPGTIQHSSVLAPVIREYPSALLWYGFYAGAGRGKASERNQSRRSGSELPPIARWIARALLRHGSPWDTPTCDISWGELSVLSKTGDDPLANIIRANQGSAEIELYPGVWTVINVNSKTDTADTGRRTRTARNEHLLSIVRESMARLNLAVNDLIQEQPPEQQASLFPTTKRRR